MGIPRTPWGGTSSVRRSWRTEILRQALELRQRWIAAADRWRDTYRRAARNVEDIYRTLQSDLDPDRGPDRERFIWLLKNSRTYDQTFFEIIHRFDSPHLGSERRRARLTAAQCLGTMGRLEEATEIAEQLLEPVVDSDRDDPHFESTVLSTLTVFYAWQRREVEMLAVLRRLRGPRTTPTAERHQIVLDQKEALALDVLDESPRRVRLQLEELRRRVESAEALHTPVLKWVHAVLAEIALEQGNAELGQKELVRFEELSGPESPDWNATPSGTLYGRLALAQGDPRTALERIDLARADKARNRRPYMESRLALVAIEAAAALGDKARWQKELESLLTLAETSGRPAAGPRPSHRAAVGWRVGVEIARLATAAGTDEEFVERALAAAGDCLVDRLLEIERFSRLLPEPAGDESEDAIRYRTRFRDRYPELIGPLERAFERRRGDLPISLIDPTAELTCCAWCLGVKSQEVWIPVGHLIPRNEAIPLTHGICPRCIDREKTRLSAPTQEPADDRKSIEG